MEQQEREWGRVIARRRALGAGPALGAVALAACGGPAARVDTNPAGGGQLQWWIIGGQPQVEILEGQVLPDYKRERPQVAVTLTSNASWNDHNTKLLAAMAATPPDVARIKDYWTSDYQSRGALAELDAYVKADKLDLVAKHGAARLVSTQEGGKTYALPFTTGTLHQFFNPDLLRESGFVEGGAPTPPETWNERREMARRMTDRTRERWGNAMYACSTDQSTTTDFMQWVMQNGVEWMSQDLAKFTFNTPEGVETLQYLQDLIWKDQTTIPPGSAVQNPRETGKVAPWVGGSWNISEFRKNFPDMKFTTALNPEKKTRSVMLQANNLVLFEESKACDLAWTLLRHMNKDASDLAWNAAAGYDPVALANFDKPPYSTDPAWQVVTRQVRRPDSKPYPIVINYQEMKNAIGEELVRAFKNEVVAKEALGEAHRRAQELLEKEVAGGNSAGLPGRRPRPPPDPRGAARHPELAGEALRMVVDEGQYNEVVVVRDPVFRFPRFPAGVARLPALAHLLRDVRRHVALATPDPLEVMLEPPEVGEACLGYPQLAGEPLTRDRLAAVTGAARQDALAAQPAAFLVERHAVPAAEAVPAGAAQLRHPQPVGRPPGCPWWPRPRPSRPGRPGVRGAGGLAGRLASSPSTPPAGGPGRRCPRARRRPGRPWGSSGSARRPAAPG